MRKIALTLALALAPVAAFAASLGVPVDQSTYVTLSAPAHNIILGNPAIADVSVSDQRHLVVTGKGAGITNLIVTDAGGRTIFDRQIVVGAGTGDHVLLINGASMVRYACTPNCEPMDQANGAPAASAQPAPSTSTYGASAPASSIAPRAPQP
jgi:hypothetical protein